MTKQRKAEAVFAAMTIPCKKCGLAGRKWEWEGPNLLRRGLHPNNGGYCENCLQGSMTDSWGMCEDGIIRRDRCSKTIWTGTA